MTIRKANKEYALIDYKCVFMSHTINSADGEYVPSYEEIVDERIDEDIFKPLLREIKTRKHHVLFEVVGDVRFENGKCIFSLISKKEIAQCDNLYHDAKHLVRGKKNIQHRKYLEELGQEFSNFEENWNPLDVRNGRWAKDRALYGFDERETWDLGRTVKRRLYERLVMFKEVAGKVIKLDSKEDYALIEVGGKKLTLKQCLDRMIQGLKLDMTLDEDFDSVKRSDPKIKKKIDDVFVIFKECCNALWW
jgi:hypothetical protein